MSRKRDVCRDKVDNEDDSLNSTKLDGVICLFHKVLNTYLYSVAEVKRNPKKISISKIRDKMYALPKECFGKYNLSVQAFSLEDM